VKIYFADSLADKCGQSSTFGSVMMAKPSALVECH